MSFWPSAEQELLLRAVALEGEAAAAAYRAWAARVDVEALDYGSQRLLPFLYRRLRDREVQAAHIGKFKGAYRRALYRNTLTLRSAIDVLRLLRSAGFEALVLKGVAMVALYYRELGVRPMSDFDILVRPQTVRGVIDVLQSQRWFRRGGPAFTDGFFTVHYGWPFRHPTGGALDLHWYLLDQSCAPEADVDLWSTARSVEVEGYPIRVLNPADQLLHVCVHGAGWDRLPNLRWVADAAVIVKQSGDQIDWDRLASQAEAHGVVVPLQATLTYLSDRFEVPIPERALRQLRAAPTTRQQRMEFRWRASQPRVLHPLFKIWFGYLRDRRTRRQPAGPWYWTFPDYLQRRWGTAGPWQLPGVGLSLFAEKLGLRRP
jgi:hypothetical protein